MALIQYARTIRVWLMRDLVPIAGTAAAVQQCRYCSCRNRKDKEAQSTRGTETEPTKTIRFLEESFGVHSRDVEEVDFVELGGGGSEVIGKDIISQMVVVA